MAKAKKISRKELKAPDEFLTLTARTLSWLETNRQMATGVGTAVLVLILAVAGYQSYQSQKLTDANADFARAVAKLDTDDKGASAALVGVSGSWGDTSVGAAATVLATAADVKAGNFDAAIARAPQALTAASSLPGYFRQEVLISWAAALESKGSFKDAAEKYGQAAAEKGPFLGQALLGQARTAARSGDAAKSRELYKQFAEKFTDSAEVEFARQQAGA